MKCISSTAAFRYAPSRFPSSPATPSLSSMNGPVLPSPPLLSNSLRGIQCNSQPLSATLQAALRHLQPPKPDQREWASPTLQPPPSRSTSRSGVQLLAAFRHLQPPQASQREWASPSLPKLSPISTSCNEGQLLTASRCASSRFPSSPATLSPSSMNGPVLPSTNSLSKIHFVE
jgi:hypothetical protein